ncbi:MAG: UDP-N-acetylmuramate--L-alanine ligase [Planctomycetaceae bacterium]
MCGSGMRSLAEYLLDRGWRVTGSDSVPLGHNAAVLRGSGITIVEQVAETEPPDCDVVIYSPAIPDSNPERKAARERGIPEVSYPAMLGRLMSGHTGIAIAGTHGKSTTTALLGWVLQHAGLRPSVVCGGELLNTCRGGWAGSGGVFVAEACEYRGSFLNLAAQHAAVLDIEPDHFDCYADLDAAVRGYQEFVSRVPPEGLIACRADRPAVAAAVAGLRARVSTFGVETAADWTASDIARRPGRIAFRIAYRGQHWSAGVLHVPGVHNVLNALAAAALAAELGVTPPQFRAALADFRGVRRRCERLGAWRGAELLDDYAHHPTAVAATIAAARDEFPGRRLICAFQPHQVSRTRMLLAELAASLGGADQVLILPVYSARETAETARATSEKLASAVPQGGSAARYIPTLDRLVTTLETDARPGDVILLVGAGDIDRVRDEFSRRIPRYYAS